MRSLPVTLPGCVLVLLLGFVPALEGQRAPASPSPPLSFDHWSWELLEALDVAGAASAWMTGVRPTARQTAWRELRRVREEGFGTGSAVASWADRFERELPAAGAGSWEVRAASGARSGDAFLDPGQGAFGSVSLAARLGRASFWGEVEEGAREAFGGVRSAGVALPLGAFDVMVGRQRVKGAGPGWTSAHLGGEVPLDGVYVVSNRRVALPGLEWLLGPTAWHAALAPLHGVDDLDQGWFGLGGFLAEPHPRLRIGATRVVQFAGHPDAPLTAERLLRSFFLVQNDPMNWDDQKLELSLRYRWGIFGQPLASYVVLAQEDSPLWKDPGILVGMSAPLLRENGLYNFRYEYTAYGQRARWCPGCEYARAAHGARYQGEWFNHGRMGLYTDRGLPMGDALGGYGANHKASVAYFSSNGQTRARAWTFFEVREEGNLLYDRWPGKRRGGGLELGHELGRGMEGTVSGVVADGPQIEREWGLRLSLSAVWGGRR